MKKFDWKHILLGVLIIALIFTNIRTCVKKNEIIDNNLIAMNDTIRYYNAKNGEIVASKTLLQATVNQLKKANDSLYYEIKNMKVKNPVTAVKVVTETIFEPSDTVWVAGKDSVIHSNDTVYQTIVDKDTIYITANNADMFKEFSFTNQWRQLEGNVWSKDTLIGLNIIKDKVNFDYTVVIDEDSKVYIKSSNPYVRYNSISGFVLPKKKQKRFGLGVSGGYGFANGKLTPYIGLGINYNIIELF